MDYFEVITDASTGEQTIRPYTPEEIATAQAAAQAATESAYAIALQRYQAGLSNYLFVLSTEAPVLAQRRQRLDLAARALDTQVQILHAIGGDLPLPTAQ